MMFVMIVVMCLKLLTKYFHAWRIVADLVVSAVCLSVVGLHIGNDRAAFTAKSLPVAFDDGLS